MSDQNQGRAPKVNLVAVDTPLLNAEILKNALEMTGCDDEADLIDMANVGKSLMERIDSLVGMPGPYFRWSPADDPAEIVFDLVNDLDELREENTKLKAVLEKISSPTQTTDLLWWQVEARAALATTEGPDRG